jgi:hypothetical protein
MVIWLLTSMDKEACLKQKAANDWKFSANSLANWQLEMVASHSVYIMHYYRLMTER